MASKPTCDGSCSVTASGAAGRHRASGKKTLGLQLFAAKADDHCAAAEIRIEANVPERPDRNLGVRCLDRYAAAVNVLKADHVVDIGVLGE
jgi:hypothetical protein